MTPCNTAFIYAETPKLLPPTEDNKLLFQEQTQYLNKLFNDVSFQINLANHNELVGFKGQNQLLKEAQATPSIFMGKNERLIRQLIKKPLLDVPPFDLEFLAMETMLNSLMIVMVFDISDIDPETNIFFRQGYPFEFIKQGSEKYSLNNIPIMAIKDKIIGSPFLPKHALPITQDTKKVLISIFQIGKKAFFEQKDFNAVTNQFINQAQTRCQVKISKVIFFKGMPIIDSQDSMLDDFKIFVDTSTQGFKN